MECPVCTEEINQHTLDEYDDNEVFDCPNCGTELCFEDSKLVEFFDESDIELDEETEDDLDPERD